MSSGTSSSPAKGYVEEIQGRKDLNTVMTSCLAFMIVHVSCAGHTYGALRFMTGAYSFGLALRAHTVATPVR